MSDFKRIDEILAKVIDDLTALRQDLKGETKPEPEPEITHDDVRKFLAELSRDGFTAQVRELLRKHGAKKLSEVDPKEYKTLLQEAGEIKHVG